MSLQGARTGEICRTVTPPERFRIMSTFCREGSALLTTDLRVWSTESGAVIADLAAPELLAWDPEAKMQRLRALAESARSFEELKPHVEAEGFSHDDIYRVLFMKTDHDRKHGKN